LYREPTETDIIMEMASKDARNIATGDILLVAGTSLKILGIHELIKVIGSAVTNVNGNVIYLDLNPPPTFLERYF